MSSNKKNVAVKRRRNRAKTVVPLQPKKVRVIQSKVVNKPARGGAKGVITQDKRVKLEKEKTLGFATVKSTNLQMGTGVMIVPTEMLQSELVYALMTYASNVFFKGTIGAGETASGVTNAAFNAGLAYLGAGMQTISKGATAELTTIPKIFDVMTELLCEKKVPIHSGIIHYTPQWDVDFDLTHTITTATGSVFTLVPPTSAPTIVCPITSVSPSSDGYSCLLRVSDDSQYGSKVVDFGSSKGLLEADPSCYARNYNYFGASGDVGSLYNESEMEVGFHYPQFAKFVKYDSADAVVSRVFQPQSGSIVTPVGLSLTASKYNAKSLRNSCPVQYKFLDFNTLYCTVVTWLIAVWESVPPNLQGNTLFTGLGQFNFSINEFQWLLRQAVLSIFPEQCHAQFVAPVKSSPSASNSVFEPFIVDSITSPNALYSQMMLPLFIVENLNMLKSRFLDNSTGTDSFTHNFIPVWGVYSGDTPPVFVFTDGNGTVTPMFNPVSTMPGASIWDASAAAIGTKVQVNNFLPEFLNEWNMRIDGFAKRSSTKLSMMEADSSSIASLLPYTRVINKIGEQEIKMGGVQLNYNNPADDFILNKPVDISKKDKKGKVNAIPPATYYELETKTITSQVPLNAEIQGAIRFFMLPSIRLNYTSGDLLTLNAYQIYTGEICQSTNINGTTNIAPNELYRIFGIGINLASGYPAADPNNDVLTAAVATLSDKGIGLDFLKALLGGISSVIPVVGPILSGLIGG